MENIEQAMQAVIDKNFVDFEKSIKNEIDTRLSNSDIVTAHKSEFDKLQSINKLFQKINTEFGDNK